MIQPAYAVIVTRADWTEFVHTLCHADVFDGDELTITNGVTQREERIYAAGTWRKARAVDAKGYVDYAFVSRMHVLVDVEARQIARMDIHAGEVDD